MSFNKLFMEQFIQSVAQQNDADGNLFSEYCVQNQVEPLNKPTEIYHKHKKSMQKIIPQLYSIDTSTDYFSDYVADVEFSQKNQQHLIKALKNGKYKIIASIDLHNNTQSRAMRLLEIFLENNSTPSGYCIKIIHGKGLGSANGISVLKNMVRRYLEHNKNVLAYTSGNTNQGGDGVTLVKLR